MSWKFGENHPLTNKAWSEKVTRNAEHKLIWAPLMYPAGPTAKGVIRHPDYGKGAPIIKVHGEFRTKPGDELTLPNVASVNTKPVMGDARAKNQKTTLTPYDMKLKYDAARIPPITSEGKLNDKKTTLNFREEAKVAGASWARRTTEGVINAHLFGIKNPANTAVVDRLNLPRDCSTVFNNEVQEFDAGHIVYAGGKSNDSQVAADPTAVLTADFLDRLITTATEDLDIPLEPCDLGNGEEGFLFVLPGRGVEQLRADPDYRESVTQYDGALNQLLKRKLVKYGPFVFLEYGNCLDPLANVGRGLILGKDALHFAKVMDWEWWEGVEDTHDWINLISIGAMLGAKGTIFNGARRNALAVDFYKRS
jgi:hypothetical protein